MAGDARYGGLHTIFSVFLGLMLTAFVGVGTYTFHPPPTALRDSVASLASARFKVQGTRPDEQLNVAQQAELQAIDAQRERLQAQLAGAEKAWRRSTSLIVIVLATLAMACSLVRASELPVLSNGLLLGGVFTMLYGIGWIIQGDTSITRFLVIAIALLVTVVLGYLRFARGPRPVASPGWQPGTVAPELEQRVRALEQRLEEAAQVLRGKD